MRIVTLLSLVFCVLFSGCASKTCCLPSDQGPASNYQEIVVEKPFDFVYLAVFDVANMLSSWVPDQTVKNEGLIRLRNTQYSRFDDSDRRTIEINIRRDDNSHTRVLLAPQSRNVIGASDVFEAIRLKLDVA